MKIEPNKITKVIEQNYTHLMPDFFKMQTEYLASLNMIYNDLDASLVAMVLTSQFYKNIIKIITEVIIIQLNTFTELITFKFQYLYIK